jgi:phosphoglycerol geranylgeranyltransferase
LLWEKSNFTISHLSFLEYIFSVKNLILNHLLANTGNGSKQLAVLIDPDSVSDESMLVNTCKMSNAAGADLILVGGSLITNGFFERSISIIKEQTDIPVVLFPGSIMQISNQADAILFLSLISGRNPDMLIGKHVQAAPTLKKSGIEVIPTGYMLIDGGNITSVSYMSNTTPIPSDKAAIAACTAMAGEMLGLKLIYMDAGSGAKQPIPAALIREVKQSISAPLFVGGGMRTPEAVKTACDAGADIVVVGNAIEKDPSLIAKLVNAIK